MKKLFLLLTISLLFASCFSTNEETTKEQEKEQYIQDNFCGVNFGANKTEVITQFEKNGFYLYEQSSSDEELDFFRPGKEYFVFEGGYWKFLSVGFNFNRFWCISFVHTTPYREEAINNFNNIVSSLSSKYELERPLLEGNNVLGAYETFTKEGKGLVIKCFKNEDYGYYQTSLHYGDKKFNSLIE